jgi:L-seryl-tRNA(Ser) seleniumtransferase
MKTSKRTDNQPSYSRRRFLRASRTTVAALSALPMLSSATEVLAATVSGGSANEHDYYDKLGVTKLINAAGTYTELTSAVMPPPVRAAVMQAALQPVHLEELQQ